VEAAFPEGLRPIPRGDDFLYGSRYQPKHLCRLQLGHASMHLTGSEKASEAGLQGMKHADIQRLQPLRHLAGNQQEVRSNHSPYRGDQDRARVHWASIHAQDDVAVLRDRAQSVGQQAQHFPEASCVQPRRPAFEDHCAAGEGLGSQSVFPCRSEQFVARDHHLWQAALNLRIVANEADQGDRAPASA
jgi:hypothetical protein